MEKSEAILDTNTIIRFLLKDDVNMALRVRKLLLEDRFFYIYDVVISEIIWVLLKVYKIEKKEILNTLRDFFTLENVLYSKPRIDKAFEIWESHNISYVDSYLLAGNAIDRRNPLYTFDVGILKIKVEGTVATEPPY